MGEIKEFRRGDGVAVATLFDKYFPRDPRKALTCSRSGAYYEWKYGPNPFGESLSFCYWEGDEIVGLNGTVPSPAMIRGERVTVYQSCDAFVAPPFQGKGIASRLQERNWAEVDRRSKLIYIVTPEPYSYAVSKKIRTFYDALVVRQFFSPLRPDECLGLSCVNLLIPIRWLTTVLRESLFHPQRVTVEAVDDICDGFFAAPPPDCDFTTLRNPVYMDFRYRRCPEPYEFFRARDDQHDVALVVKFVSWRDAIICYLIDALGSSGVDRYDTFLASALYAIGLQRGAAIVSIQLPVRGSGGPSLGRVGFIGRKRKGALAMSQNQWPFLNPASPEHDSRRWVFFSGDGDNF